MLIILSFFHCTVSPSQIPVYAVHLVNKVILYIVYNDQLESKELQIAAKALKQLQSTGEGNW